MKKAQNKNPKDNLMTHIGEKKIQETTRSKNWCLGKKRLYKQRGNRSKAHDQNKGGKGGSEPGTRCKKNKDKSSGTGSDQGTNIYTEGN